MGIYGGFTEEGRSPPPSHLLVKALEGLPSAFDSPAPRAQALGLLCEMTAGLVDAPAAGHARFHGEQAVVQMTVWRHGRASRAEALERPEEPPRTGEDWWIGSRNRDLLFDSLGQRYLAELPMNPDPTCPSLVVVGRSRPFETTDSEQMSRHRRALRALECLIEAILTRSRTSETASEPCAGLLEQLTPREAEVLRMLGEGLLARSIAQRLHVSERTVHKHLGSVYRKLDAHDRLLAVRRAQALGLIPAPAQAG